MSEITIGPRTSHREFFEKHVNLALPQFAGIKDALEKDDIALADKIFADAMRKEPMVEKLKNVWQNDVDGFSEKLKEGFIARAKDIMDYKVISCGIPYHFKDHKIDWEFNATYNNYCEWPWQLSRHPEWSHLAKYYLLTGDEQAAQTYADMLDSWLKQAVVPENVSGYKTITWRTIEAGIRMMSWCHQISCFINSPALTDKLITEYYISIYEHGWRLRNFCTHGNWLIMELHGLIRISVTATFLNDAQEWYEYALKRLCDELDIQIYPDGFQYELSTGYHGVVDGNYVNVLRIFDILGLDYPKVLTEKLERCFDIYPQLSRPDRCMPPLNDAGDVNIVGKMRTALTLYPEREDFRWFATGGKEGKAPDYLSYAFPYAGSVIMRTGWDSDAIWAYMDCSPFGRGHQHEDKLNVLISAYGKKLLTEAGIYDYDTSEMRRYVLSTRAHNTVMIGGKEQCIRPRYRWADEDIFKKADFEFTVNDDYELAKAQYDQGYGKEFDDVKHERKLIFIKKAEGTTPFFVAIDRFTAPDAEKRKYEAIWHFENCDFKAEGQYASGDFGDGVGLTVVTSDKEANVIDMMGQYEPYYQGWMPIRPSGPHEHRPVPTPVFVGAIEGARRTVTVLYPYKDGKNVVKSVSACADVNATEFSVTLTDGNTLHFDEKDLV